MSAYDRRRGGLALTLFAALTLVLSLSLATAAQAQPAGHITGVGGIFLKSKDPKALARWYRDVLGIPLERWGGALLKYDAPGHPPVVDFEEVKNTDAYKRAMDEIAGGLETIDRLSRRNFLKVGATAMSGLALGSLAGLLGTSTARADKTVDYDTLMQAMNGLRASGYLKVSLVGLDQSS